MTPQQKALKYFKEGFNCSQAVLTALGTDMNFSEDQCLRISCAFGAGMGRQQLTCGAISGALMVLGIKYGKSLNEDESKKANTYKKSKALMDQFTDIHKTICCKELLLGLDLHNPDEYAKIKDLGLFESRCTQYVSDAVCIAERILSEE